MTFQARYARDDLTKYEGQQAFLFFEMEHSDKAEPTSADEVAKLLLKHRVPVVILNACQSGKQVGESETSLGSRLLRAGVQTVLAMGYSVTVTVSAARLLMQHLYRALFDQQPLPEAIRQGRLALHNQKGRHAYYNLTIDLEDWLLPVMYQRGGVQYFEGFPLRDFKSFEEESAWLDQQARRYRAPEPEYGFVGRDLDILLIEKRLLRREDNRQPHNLLLLRGMGGAGKTSLLHHVAEWWQTTGFVRRVFYFGYDLGESLRQAYFKP